MRSATFVAVVLVALAGCTPSGPRGMPCGAAGDCAGLLCRLGRCRSPCSSAADCSEGRCLLDRDATSICAVRNDTCRTDSECTSPLICADGRCSNACTEPIDCAAGMACQITSRIEGGHCVPIGSIPIASDASTPSEVRVVSIAAGDTNACALTSSGTVWCWGDASTLGDGVMGRARCAVSGVPCSTRPVRVGASHAASTIVGTSFRHIELSRDHAYALDPSFGLFTWGVDAATPQPVALAPINAVFAGDGFVYAIASTGAGIIAWGSNAHAEIRSPAGPTLNVTLVTRVPPSDAVRLSGHHGCAAAGARAVCWGGNERAQSGAPPSHHVEQPTSIAMLSSVTALALSDLGSCALIGTGISPTGLPIPAEVWCWGDRTRVGTNDPLTDGQGTCTSIPVRAHLPTAFRIFGGPEATAMCAETMPGMFWCWGDNRGGAIGPSLPDVVLEPVIVDALGGASELAIGAGFLCGLFDGRVRCGGANASGQLGRGTSTVSENFANVVIPL